MENTGTPFSGSRTTASANGLTGGRTGEGFIPGSQATASTFSNAEWYIPNYRSAVAKSWSIDAVGETNGTSPLGMEIIAGLWTGTDAITSITMTGADGLFVQFSSATLYGVTRGTTPGVTVS